MEIYPLEDKHLPEVLAIYNHYILHSTATFHIQPIGMDELRGFLPVNDPRWPSFVMVEEDMVRGYAYVGKFKTRQAYQTTGEVTIYLHPDCTGKRWGGKVLKLLEDCAAKLGLHVLIGCLCAENEASIKLFERHGYQRCAYYHEVGNKFGRWLDVVEYEKMLT